MPISRYFDPNESIFELPPVGSKITEDDRIVPTAEPAAAPALDTSIPENTVAVEPSTSDDNDVVSATTEENSQAQPASADSSVVGQPSGVIEAVGIESEPVLQIRIGQRGSPRTEQVFDTHDPNIINVRDPDNPTFLSRFTGMGKRAVRKVIDGVEDGITKVSTLKSDRQTTDSLAEDAGSMIDPLLRTDSNEDDNEQQAIQAEGHDLPVPYGAPAAPDLLPPGSGKRLKRRQNNTGEHDGKRRRLEVIETPHMQPVVHPQATTQVPGEPLAQPPLLSTKATSRRELLVGPVADAARLMGQAWETASSQVDTLYALPPSVDHAELPIETASNPRLLAVRLHDEATPHAHGHEYRPQLLVAAGIGVVAVAGLMAAVNEAKDSDSVEVAARDAATTTVTTLQEQLPPPLSTTVTVAETTLPPVLLNVESVLPKPSVELAPSGNRSTVDRPPLLEITVPVTEAATTTTEPPTTTTEPEPTTTTRETTTTLSKPEQFYGHVSVTDTEVIVVEGGWMSYLTAHMSAICGRNVALSELQKANPGKDLSNLQTGAVIVLPPNWCS